MKQLKATDFLYRFILVSVEPLLNIVRTKCKADIPNACIFALGDAMPTITTYPAEPPYHTRYTQACIIIQESSFMTSAKLSLLRHSIGNVTDSYNRFISLAAHHPPSYDAFGKCIKHSRSKGRFPFNQTFRFEFLELSSGEWYSIFGNSRN